MESIALGAAVTAALAVIAWAAKTAISDPRTFVLARPFMLSAFCMLVAFGAGLLIGHVTELMTGLLVLGGSAAAVFAVLMLNVLAAHAYADRKRSEDNEDG